MNKIYNGALMKNHLFFLVFLILFFSGCETLKTHSLSADLRNGCGNMEILTIDANVDGVKKSIVEEQAFTIIQSYLSYASSQCKNTYNLEIKMYDRSFLSDAEFLHSLFISFFIYDKEGNAVAVVSEYSTGKESFQSPEVQEKFIKKCISKVIEMRL